MVRLIKNFKEKFCGKICTNVHKYLCSVLIFMLSQRFHFMRCDYMKFETSTCTKSKSCSNALIFPCTFCVTYFSLQSPLWAKSVSQNGKSFISISYLLRSFFLFCQQQNQARNEKINSFLILFWVDFNQYLTCFFLEPLGPIVAFLTLLILTEPSYFSTMTHCTLG